MGEAQPADFSELYAAIRPEVGLFAPHREIWRRELWVAAFLGGASLEVLYAYPPASVPDTRVTKLLQHAPEWAKRQRQQSKDLMTANQGDLGSFIPPPPGPPTMVLPRASQGTPQEARPLVPDLYPNMRPRGWSAPGMLSPKSALRPSRYSDGQLVEGPPSRSRSPRPRASGSE